MRPMSSFGPYGRDVQGYDVAQVCLNGHLITRYAASDPKATKKFCDKCGAATIVACPKCSKAIQGQRHGAMPSMSASRAPAYCHECGNAYPWTEQRLADAQQLADEEANFNPDEREQFRTSLQALTRDTASAPLAVSRFKKLVIRSGHLVSDGLRDILVDVLSEAVKKQIWGP